jgi:hypothetical protein
MVLSVEFGKVDRFNGSDLKKYPVATARIFNNGKVSAKDIRVESSTGWVAIDVTHLPPDSSAILTFAVVKVHEVNLRQSTEFQPDETPYVVGVVKLSVTWRIDGSSERSQPVTFEENYSHPPFG